MKEKWREGEGKVARRRRKGKREGDGGESGEAFADRYSGNLCSRAVVAAVLGPTRKQRKRERETDVSTRRTIYAGPFATTATNGRRDGDRWT